MNRNYRDPFSVREHFGLMAGDIEHWAEVRETHPAVAYAIFAIADSKRAPEEIWDAPTSAELNHISMAVQEYVTCGDYEPANDGLYQWGMEAVTV